MNGLSKVVGAAVCVGVVLAGCSVGNTGGDTTCAAFNKMDTDGQSAAIKKMLTDKGKNPSNLEVTATRMSAVGFCKTLGKDSSKIRDIDTG